MDDRRKEDQARRAAKRVGLKACKSRSLVGSINNRGGFRVVDPQRNYIVAGERHDFTAEDVIAFCKARLSCSNHGEKRTST
jgi:hypothetical protein